MNDTQDAIDVEFETVTTDGEKIVNSARAQTSMPGSTSADEEQLAVFGKKSNSFKNRPMSLPIFTLVASIGAVTAFYLAGGHVLFSQSQPQTIIAENPGEPLQFENVISEMIDRNGNQIMSIQATILNTDKVAQVIPSVIVHIGDDPTTWRMFRIDRGETLNPGERLVFTNTVRTGDVPGVEPKLSFSE